jgi:MFS family permease
MNKAIAATIACAMCMALGQAALFVGTFPIFLPAVSKEFGWGAGVFPQALLTMGAANVLASFFGGGLIDRFGVRWLVLLSLIGWAATLFAMSQLNGSESQLLIVAVLMGVVTCFSGPVALAKVVAGWFDRHRGLALALSLGTAPAIGTASMLILSNTLIETHGWRFAYQVLAVLVVVITIPLAALFMREAPSAMPGHPGMSEVSDDSTVKQALLSGNFWMIVLVTTLVCTVANAVTAHFVAWSAEHGITQTAATFALSAYSLASPIGTIASGAVADRVQGPKPLAIFYGLPLIGLGLLLLIGPVALIPAMIFMGAGFGAASGLLPFLVTRYFGVKHAAQLIGIGIGLFVLLLGVGPVVFGLVHDRYQSFAPANPVLLILLALAVVACLSLRRYSVTTPPPSLFNKPVNKPADAA